MLHSDGKIQFFYKSVMVALGTTILVVALSGGISAIPPLEQGNSANHLNESDLKNQVQQVVPQRKGHQNTPDKDGTRKVEERNLESSTTIKGINALSQPDATK